MSSVDSRIVTMKFDNATFEKNASTSLSTLDKLKQSMNFGSIGNAASKGLGAISSIFSKFGFRNPFSTAEKGVADLQAETNKFTVGPITGGITSVSKSFVAMSTVAILALSNIASQAFRTGSAMVKSLTVDPIKGGLEEYETNLNSIQTILANTKASGATLEDVNKALQDLNHYSDQTIYNFSQMARNIGTFTAAGVDLDTSTAAIKGIANLAALSGSNSEQASSAMYQLSQEMAAGRVSLMGWNSVVNAGMGGTTFQRALAQTAVAMGEIDSSAVKLDGKMKNVKVNGQSFRDSIMAKPGEVSWLSAEVLTSTLKQFTGDMSDADLAAQGFNKSQIEAIKSQAKTAKDAATKVKTLTGVLDTAKEVVGSGWAQTWQTIFGDFKEARKLFTNVSNIVNGFLGGMADGRNKMLGDWKDLGGRKIVIEAIANAFEALRQVLTPIRDAFRDIFPAKTGEDLLELSKGFLKFTKSLAIGDGTAKNLRRTFAGVFAIFSIIGQVIGSVAGLFSRLFGSISEGSGGFLEFTGTLGDALVAFDQFLEKSGVLEGFFKTLGDILAVPLQILGSAASLIGSIFTGFDSGSADKVIGAIDKFGERVEPLEAAGERIRAIFGAIGDILSSAGEAIGNALLDIGDALGKAITPETFSSTLDVINTALLGGIVLMLRNFFSGGLKIDATGGLFDSVKETLGGVTETLGTMQASIKADIIMKIAGALALLTASLVVLSMIDGKKLTKALTVMAVGFAGLSVSLATLSTAISFIGVLKLPIISAALIALATALLILSLALKILTTMNFGEMMRGLFGMSAMLFIISKAIVPLSANAGGMLRAAAALTILGVALNIMALALKVFASMSWEEMGQGLVGVAGTLILVAAAMRLMPKGMVLQATAILILSGALNAMGVALKIFASMSWEEIGKGMVVLAGALAIIAATMHLMPKGMLLQAAALVAVGVALNLIGLAIKGMGGMGWEEIAKGLVALAGAMLILAVGLNAMSGAIPGAVALTVAAAALAVLVPVLITLGNLDWMTIVKGLTALAGIFVVLGLAGFILAPIVPVLIGLGLALTLVGAGMLLAGAGAMAFATAFGIIVATGSAGVKLLGLMIATIVESIPEMMAAFGRGVVEFVKVIGKAGPDYVKAMSTILSSMLDAIILNVPKMGTAFMTMLNTGLRVVVNATPRIVNAGLNLIVRFLAAVSRNVPKIVDIAADIIVKFLNGIARNLGRIIQSGVDLIIAFINGVADAIDNNSAALGEAGGRLAVAMVRGMANGITSYGGIIKDAAMDAARAAWEAVKDFFDVNSPSRKTYELGGYVGEGLANGISDSSDGITRSAKGVGKAALDTLRMSMSGVSDALSGEVDFNPVIAPVLDLTRMSNEASKIGTMLETKPITAGVSFDQASSISAEREAAREAALQASAEETTPAPIVLHQTNNSPKALSAADIYRQTNNQLALAREALKA